MLKADLHVHSRYSSTPADALLKTFGTQESYTEVEEIYRLAKERGMDFVTITDHNVIGGALKLVEQYPADSFLGVELTAMFPEDGCAVHVLVYDFTPEQFAEMAALRHDIYRLRDYIRKAGLPYSVAHPSYSVNGKLTIAVIEKLLLLFDVFETINGARVAAYNDLFRKVLSSLTPARMEALAARHLIEPFGETPWIKSFTGGSDEHAGLFIGETYTLAESTDKKGFLGALRARATDSGGAIITRRKSIHSSRSPTSIPGAVKDRPSSARGMNCAAPFSTGKAWAGKHSSRSNSSSVAVKVMRG